jgi:hypothetical protein
MYRGYITQKTKYWIISIFVGLACLMWFPGMIAIIIAVVLVFVPKKNSN